MAKKKRPAKPRAKGRGPKQKAAQLKPGEALLAQRGDQWRVQHCVSPGMFRCSLFAMYSEAVDWCHSRNLRTYVLPDERRRLGLRSQTENIRTADSLRLRAADFRVWGRGGDLRLSLASL
jgi:ribosomal protein L27